MYKLSCLLILITLQLFQLCSSSDECSRQNKLKQIIRGNYKNVISYENGSLLTSWKQNIFNGSNQFIGVLLRNEIYDNIGDLKGTYCLIGGSITIQLRQQYELNTLVLWLWDGQNRYYNFIVYAQQYENEAVIYDKVSTKAKVIYIQFPAQLVSQFRIYNRDGNSVTNTVNIIRAEAYYQI